MKDWGGLFLGFFVMCSLIIDAEIFKLMFMLAKKYANTGPKFDL